VRNRSQNQATQGQTVVSDAPSLETLTQLITTRRPAPPVSPSTGKHRAPVASEIPEQKPRDRELALEVDAIEAAQVAEDPTSPAVHVPDNASWRASHLPRVFAAALLALSLVGTWVLGVRFEASRLPSDFVSLFIGVGVVVVLWALLIATTPQEIILKGSVLTIHNSSGRESFDLADGLQPIDIVGTPRQRKWAVLLHRADRTSVVLRRHDVNAAELDPIVRHYRQVVGRRFAGHAVQVNR
jgi:hypothetical protein